MRHPFELMTPQPPGVAPGDIVVSPKTRGSYRVLRMGGGGILGEAATEKEAMLLACAEQRGHTIWVVRRDDGALIAFECPDKRVVPPSAQQPPAV